MADYSGFANRLRKNLRHYDKWARRRGLQCYRVYHRDMPEFPLAIDRYADHVHIQEYVTGWKGSEQEYEDWHRTTEDTIREVMELSPRHMHFKQRKRQKGLQQYEKFDTTGEDIVVDENDLKFYVNLDSYLDTGLFLDHRITRQMVRERAAGKRFLNLFAYTGSFSVYAAAGGARETISVDLSNTYQEWTARNLDLNRLDLAQNKRVRADVFAYLGETVYKGQRFDLIVLDPPSFSNSKRMEGVLDVQRDHVRLVNQCLKLLEPGGELFFSNNLRNFVLHSEDIQTDRIECITRKTIPEDFRDPKTHHCWILQSSSGV